MKEIGSLWKIVIQNDDIIEFFKDITKIDKNNWTKKFKEGSFMCYTYGINRTCLYIHASNEAKILLKLKFNIIDVK